MKKKIILFLTFLLTAMFLTGCTQVTTAQEMKKLDELANEIAINGPGYKLPEGYAISYPDAKDTGRIRITSTTAAKKNTIKAEYKISGEEVELEKIVTEDGSEFLTFLIGAFTFLIGMCLGYYVLK